MCLPLQTQFAPIDKADERAAYEEAAKEECDHGGALVAVAAAALDKLCPNYDDAAEKVVVFVVGKVTLLPLRQQDREKEPREPDFT